MTERFYIDGLWVAPHGTRRAAIIDPATESEIGRVALADAQDVDRAVLCAQAAFPDWSARPVRERIAALVAIRDGLIARNAELAEAIMCEMGAPRGLAYDDQAPSAAQQFDEMIRVLGTYAFSEDRGPSRIVREPAGVCALITPWNWPLNQIACKVAPALAAGCTVVLKPSERAPLSADLFAEIVDAAGLPRGVFNMIHGDGDEAGRALADHAGVDMVSFTGSTRAGIDVSRRAAARVKRVSLELGGKSPSIVLDDVLFARGIAGTVRRTMENSGQSCSAPTRLLVPADRLDEALDIARETAGALRVGPPAEAPDLGPLANARQYMSVRAYIDEALADGARLVTGGSVRPQGLAAGYFIAPTILLTTPDMRIAREEVFGPVLAVMPYRDIDDAVRLANDTDYGLGAYVWAADVSAARAIAGRLRAGTVAINGAGMDIAAPFGGMKMSGNGREWGREGLEEFLEIKSIYGGADDDREIK